MKVGFLPEVAASLALEFWQLAKSNLSIFFMLGRGGL